MTGMNEAIATPSRESCACLCQEDGGVTRVVRGNENEMLRWIMKESLREREWCGNEAI